MRARIDGDEVARLYRRGGAPTEIARVLGCSPGRVGEIVRERGITPRRTLERLELLRVLRERGPDLRLLWAQGESRATIAEDLGLTVAVVDAAVAELGLRPRGDFEVSEESLRLLRERSAGRTLSSLAAELGCSVQAVSARLKRAERRARHRGGRTSP